jgi:dTDP-4-amino-4,6-dideoxygalactose transaminase
MTDAFDVVRSFEKDLCAYTGAPYAVAVNSCTMALLLACAWWREGHSFASEASHISLPRLTYVGVPYAIREAGFHVEFRDEDWQGEHQLQPLPVWDAARRFTGDMFNATRLVRRVEGGRPDVLAAYTLRKAGPRMQCVSFHHTKILGHSQGGAILHNLPEADVWLRRARFDGRTEGVPAAEDEFTQHRAWHAYMSPSTAAALRWRLSALPYANADLPRSPYPDLSLHKAFQS